MAIKVVQGLIDVRSSRASLGSSKVTPTLEDLSKTGGRAPQNLTPQQILTISNSAVQVRGSTDAALSVVRTRGAGRDANGLRDPRDAQKVADTVAERVSKGEDGRADTHSHLSASSARQHF
jgi:hypothetical protein